jgi:hypothetical protein
MERIVCLTRCIVVNWMMVVRDIIILHKIRIFSKTRELSDVRWPAIIPSMLSFGALQHINHQLRFFADCLLCLPADLYLVCIIYRLKMKCYDFRGIFRRSSSREEGLKCLVMVKLVAPWFVAKEAYKASWSDQMHNTQNLPRQQLRLVESLC